LQGYVKLLAEDYLRKSESFGMQICEKLYKNSRKCEITRVSTLTLFGEMT
jgi:hypothetical protein